MNSPPAHPTDPSAILSKPVGSSVTITAPPEAGRYLGSEDADPHRFIGPDGLPTLRLVTYSTGSEAVLAFADTVTGLLVGTTDRRLAPAGILSGQVRGQSYNKRGCRAGNYEPGASITLIAEPENEFDKFAVMVCDAKGKNKCGYLNKQKARTYHRMVKEFGPLRAISLRGTCSGELSDSVGFVAATSEVIELLLSPWPAGAPAPGGTKGLRG